MKNGLIERNPIELAELPRKREKEIRQAMTKEQQDLFMKYAKDSWLYNLFALLLRTGLRSGEIRGLKYSDIDKKNNVIHVTRTLEYIDKIGHIEDTPKTKTSKRDIPLTAATMQILDEQKREWGIKIGSINGYILWMKKESHYHR